MRYQQPLHNRHITTRQSCADRFAYGIETPEKRQDFGNRAKQFTSGMVFGKVVTVEHYDTDRYGRTIGMVYVGDQCVNEELIRSGFAWVYTKYCMEGFCSNWKGLEEAARRARARLWGHGNPIPPWKFRRNKRKSDTFEDALRLVAGGRLSRMEIWPAITVRHKT